jgi:hypothetical protein
MAYIEWVNSKKQTASTPTGEKTPKGLISKVPAILSMQIPMTATGIAIQTVSSMKLVKQLQAGTNMFYFSSGSWIRYRETAALRQLDLKLTKLPAAKPSLRRTATGFKRHTISMESKLNLNMNRLIEQLDEIK